MTLPDGPRQIAAGIVAAAAFLVLYFPLSLEWYVALPLGAVVFGGVLIAVPRRPALTEIVVAERVTAADIAAATRALDDAHRRVRRAADSAPDADRPQLAEFAEALGSLRRQVAEDPADFRTARRLVTSYLPRMVDNVEGYVTLAGRGRAEADRARLDKLREAVMGYAEVVGRINRAGLDHDLRALEAEVDALGFQLKRG